MKIETNVKAGGVSINHNQAAAGFVMKTQTKAGGISVNHNQAR
jgi:hypothetical protein